MNIRDLIINEVGMNVLNIYRIYLGALYKKLPRTPYYLESVFHLTDFIQSSIQLT